MKRFEIELRNEKARTYTLISRIILLLNLAGLVYAGLVGIASRPIYPLGGSLLLAVILAYEYTSRGSRPGGERFGLAYSLVIISWMLSGLYILAAVNFVLLLSQDITRRKLAVLFFDDRIIYPSFPRRTMAWSDLNNIVLKDGILTIDLPGDKLLQNEIVTEINERDFNEFCRERLNALNN
jgi:hypothetical protein